jgi:hypothetical protein
MHTLILILFSLTLDGGGAMDPNGGASATLDHRCTIDPNGSGCTGGLTATADTDGRSILDPIG